NQMLDVASRSSKKVIDAQDDCPVPQQTLTQVRTEKTSTTEKVRNYVQGLTRPVVGGIALDEALTVQWPTGLHALMAFLQPDMLVDRLMVEINRIANTPCPLAQREQRIAELEREIDRLQRTE